MRITAFALALVVLATAGTARADGCTIETYGAGVTVAEATPVADILDDPRPWAGKTVRVEGKVREVCRKMGCWMEIVAGERDDALRVKVADGEIVFPVAARGRRAVAQGAVEVSELSSEQHAAWRRHLAEEQGVEPAPAEPGPHLLVQVRGTGAEICR
jgi:hypothetical protein